MKRFFLSLLLLCLTLTGLIYFIALPKARAHIETILKDSGLSYARSSDINFELTGLTIQSIDLDADGFNNITNLEANIFWPTYFYKKSIDSILIDKISIFSGSGKLGDFSNIKRNFNLNKIDKFQIQKASISKIEWNFPLADYAIKIEGQLDFYKKDQKKNILLNLIAKQHEMSFSSKWIGELDNQGNSQLNAKIDDFKLNLPSLSLHRSSGWLSYNKQNKQTNFLGQLEAGSGSIFKIPAKNISFVINRNENFYPLIIRAFAGGIEDVRLSGDIRLSKETRYQNGQIKLSVPDFQKFLNHLKSQNIIQNHPMASAEPLDVSLSLMPERRFADGPLPFKVNVMREMKEELDGTLLIYPTSLDVRGNLSSNYDFLGIIKSVTPIQDEQIKENVIYLDDNLRSVIF